MVAFGNAAVVGLLAAALYDPIWTSAVRTPSDFAIALGAFALLYVKRAPVLLAIVFCLAASLIRAYW
jgi:chromate transporter